MIEPTIVFTHYALLLTATTFTILGVVIGWAVTQHQNKAKINKLQSNLKDLQLNVAENSVTASAAKQPAPTVAKMSALNKKKDLLLKDFMKRQLQQKKSLDSVTAELNQLRKAKLLTDRSLNAAHISLDQWKEKCAALAEAQTKLKRSVQAVAKSDAGKANASVKLPMLNINTTQKSAPLVTVTKSKGKASKLPPTRSAPGVITTPVDENLINEILSPARGRQNAAEINADAKKRPGAVKGKLTKLTSINGIGPAIEKELRKLGIDSVELLATLKQKEINAIDRDLGKYSGRITRQEWVKQAKALVKTTQRENAAA